MGLERFDRDTDVNSQRPVANWQNSFLKQIQRCTVSRFGGESLCIRPIIQQVQSQAEDKQDYMCAAPNPANPHSNPRPIVSAASASPSLTRADQGAS